MVDKTGDLLYIIDTRKKHFKQMSFLITTVRRYWKAKDETYSL